MSHSVVLMKLVMSEKRGCYITQCVIGTAGAVCH